MKIAIMQPYFFPYLGQFQLIYAADRYVIGTEVQYIASGWMNRNRVLKAVEGVQYINVPIIKHGSREAIMNINIVEDDSWKVKTLRQLEHYKKRSPFYNNTIEVLNECFYGQKDTRLAWFNGHCFDMVCQYLGIDFKIEISSEMNLDYSNVNAPHERVITMCKQLGATGYLNPPGGMELYKKEVFNQHNLELGFVKPNLKEYDQLRPVFEPGLSIIDIMMFNSPADIQLMLKDYELL